MSGGGGDIPTVVAGLAAATGAGTTGVVNAAYLKSLGNLNAHSWNIFRYIADYMHLFGVFVLLATLAKNKSCRGISRTTQVLYFTVFIFRYLDLLDRSQTSYLVIFKLTYIFTSIAILIIFRVFRHTHEVQKDTCSLAVIYLPCVTAAFLLSDEHSSIELLWTLSRFLEGFAMVPQYIFCYRDRGTQRDWGVSLYVFSMGGYRTFYAANWIYKKVNMPHYWDMQSWLGGVIEMLFFVDYIFSQTIGCSLLRTMVLQVDEKINEIKDKVEAKVLGSSKAVQQDMDGGGDCELRQRRKGAAEEEPIDV